MNCKQGDLAVAVRSAAGNEGRLMMVVGWIGAVEGFEGDDYWKVDADRPLNTRLGVPVFLFRDSCLRPIRDPGDDARDETLDWLPSPVKEHA